VSYLCEFNAYVGVFLERQCSIGTTEKSPFGVNTTPDNTGTLLS